MKIVTFIFYIQLSIITLAICSIHRPRDINTNNIGGVSKKVIGLVCLAGVSVIAMSTTMTEYT